LDIDAAWDEGEECVGVRPEVDAEEHRRDRSRHASGVAQPCLSKESLSNAAPPVGGIKFRDNAGEMCGK
jgi:hypothetical protein